MKVLDFVSIGEVLVQFNPLTPGPLRYAKYFEVHVAGSEANILIGLSKLGFRTGLITRVGDDEFGKLILNTLRGEGVDISRVKVDPSAPTGIYFVQRHFPVPGRSTVLYYRHGSAASRLSPEDVDENYVKNARAVIITGITMALSESCLRAVEKLYKVAKDGNLDVILDTNIRLKLWRDKQRARTTLMRFIKEGVDIVFTNAEDLSILFPEYTTHEAAKEIISYGTRFVVIKRGARGAVVVDSSGRVIEHEGFHIHMIEDVIGAGDAFDAAFIASVYKGLSLELALEYANAAGALVVTTRGDIEAQPSWSDIELFIKAQRSEVMLR